ncbi:MAG: 23S rRNA (pseudouridine(1915)-N(3))-methyltransferase RlmH [Clostridia bacterium]|nr:23S rRNA (pseudouridine(1915)-N(3))-methyltransferase RlmH [Clostridia bacterium]
MQRVNVICVGKLKEKYLRDGVSEYAKRLQAMCKFSVTELDEERLSDESTSSINAVIAAEGRRIISRIDKNAVVIAMCIEGETMSSESLASYFMQTAVGGASTVDIIIGGSYGLSDEVKKRADLRLSMSPMTFPHQLARVMVCEQVYRAFSINNGSKYHK